MFPKTVNIDEHDVLFLGFLTPAKSPSTFLFIFFFSFSWHFIEMSIVRPVFPNSCETIHPIPLKLILMHL